MKINGKTIAEQISEDLKIKVKKLREKNIIPHLAIILIGNDPASVAYIKRKEIKAKEIGIKTILKHFPDDISQNNLISTIRQFNNNSSIHGITVQKPLPANVNLESVINAIDPKKDVDGVCPKSKFKMPIAMAVLQILKEISMRLHLYQGATLIEWLKNQKIVIIGKGETGGKPIIQTFEKMKIPYIAIGSRTKKPANLTKSADIVICAVGKANILKPQMLKKGVILIGIGISRGKSAKLMGDYAENEISNIASFYTPTPGGVGPVNVAMLLKNLVYAASL